MSSILQPGTARVPWRRPGAEAGEPGTGAATPSVLAIDDEPEVCNFIADICDNAGCAVRTASRPDEIIASLRHAADVVFLDLVMPELDGIHVLTELAANGSEARIILVSGYDSGTLETTVQLGRHLGLDVRHALRKPIRQAALLEALMPRGTLPPQSAPDEIDAAEIGRAIETDQLLVHYQPQVSLATGEWTGARALPRWHHAGRGLLYPRCFVPAAAAAGLGMPLTLSVLRRAILDFADATGPLESVAMLVIDVPAAALVEPLPLAALGVADGIGASRVVLRIGDVRDLDDATALVEGMTRLRQAGYGVAVADSNLADLVREASGMLPISEVDIDLSGGRAEDPDSEDGMAVEHAVQLAHTLGLPAVATGVESATQWHWLRWIKCDAASGTFVGRPRPAALLGGWLDHWLRRMP